ncbi:MAG: MFS transporter [Actinobacteria bacterium]|nr:MFS transporter [Actinomycetota bacterium]
MALSVWFSAAATVPSIRSEWGISDGEASWLTTMVQLGFVVGAIVSASFNLSDRVDAGKLICVSAGVAGTTVAILPVVATGLAVALPLRFLTGVALAGVYPVGAKVVASWFSSNRGIAMGLLLAALTIGSGLPHLVASFGTAPWRTVQFITAGMAIAGGGLALLIETGSRVHATPALHPRYVFTMFGDRKQRNVNLGYFGHMWELYAFWTWLPAFLVAALGQKEHFTTGNVELAAFAIIGIAGAIGTVIAGARSIREGPYRPARVSLMVSGACCGLSPVFFVMPTVLLLALAALWGAAVIADSPMFAAALSSVADERYVGTALTAQMAIGFLITAIAIRFLPWAAGMVGWRWTLLFLLPGPLFGAIAMRD